MLGGCTSGFIGPGVNTIGPVTQWHRYLCIQVEQIMQIETENITFIKLCSQYSDVFMINRCFLDGLMLVLHDIYMNIY